MSDLIHFFENKRRAMVDLLTELINHESPADEKAAVDRLGAFLQQQLEQRGAAIERHPREEAGDMIFARWNTAAEGKPILILSHMDTVFPLGTLAENPVKMDTDGRLYGPGAIDMKGGIVVALTAIQGLSERDELALRPIWYLLTSDEETGSKHSRSLIEDKAQQAGLVMVTEPPTRDGALKSWRKGTASYKLSVRGRAAHAGNEPEEGINSVIEFAQQALELHALNDLPNGTSVSVTRVRGGTATNVIPARTEAYIDVRALSQLAYDKVHKQIMERAAFIAGSNVNIERLHHRPPMQRDAAVVEQAMRIGQAIGITIRDDGAGGGSDGNFTAAMGIPTLDGLGPEGAGLHADHEHVIVNSLPRKAAFFAAVLRDWTF